ncbi:MAG: fructosamine kinase family protein [Cyclobacteriaceae bacterium]
MENPDFLLEKIIFSTFGGEEKIIEYHLVAAGNLNQAIYLKTAQQEYFLKTNHQNNPDIYKRESEGLDWTRNHCSLHVPKVIVTGTYGDTQYLLMEWIRASRSHPDYSEKLAEGLAELHMCTRKKFGLDVNNYISVLPQNNEPEMDWTSFFIQKRLEPMIQRAFYEGYISEKSLKEFRMIYPKLNDFFPHEKPSLLHGDLWSGNVMVNSLGFPSLIDPAVYFGHREMDLAFSKLFGGFDPSFYKAYQEVFPLDPGFEQRVEVYNLYPLLVHLNLFGTTYLSGITRVVKKLLR